MAQEKLKFNGSLNSSLQVGDTVYTANVVNGIIHGEPSALGTIFEIVDLGSSFDLIVNVGTVGLIPPDAFIMFSKSVKINESGLKGYYADVTLENYSKKRVELFSIGSEVSPSSK